MKEETYTKQKISAYMKATPEMMTERNLRIGMDGEDFINDLLTCQLEAFIYKSAQPTQTTYHYVPRPTFLDWMLKRRKVINITVECDKVLKVAPDDKSILVYNIKTH